MADQQGPVRIGWFRCINCMAPILTNIRLPENVEIQMAEPSLTFFELTCSNCGRMHNYNGTQLRLDVTPPGR